MELYWDIVSHMENILGLGATAFFGTVFIRPFMKNSKGARAAGAVYFCVMLTLYFIPYKMAGVSAYTIGCAAMCIAMYFFDAKNNIRQKIMLAVFLLLFDWIAHGVALIFWDFMFDYWLYDLSDRPWPQFVAYILVCLVNLLLRCVGLAVLIKVTGRLYTEKRDSMSNREFVFMLLPILPCLFGYYFFSYFSRIYERDMNIYIEDAHRGYFWLKTLYQVLSGGVILVVIIMLQIMKRRQKEEKENAVLAKQIADMKNHILEVEEVYRDIRSLRHDMGNHIMTLESLYKKQEWQEAEDYAKKIRKTLEGTSFSIKSGNPVTDIILEGMRKKAEAVGIRFESSFVFGVDGEIDTFDMSVILSNALANAVEGADRSASGPGGPPYIQVLSYQRKNAFMVEVRNSCTKELVLPNNGELPPTSKKDGQEHGFGLGNIRKVAQKYRGDLQIQSENGEFVLTVMLMLA